MRWLTLGSFGRGAIKSWWGGGELKKVRPDRSWARCKRVRKEGKKKRKPESHPVKGCGDEGGKTKKYPKPRTWGKGGTPRTELEWVKTIRSHLSGTQGPGAGGGFGKKTKKAKEMINRPLRTLSRGGGPKKKQESNGKVAWGGLNKRKWRRKSDVARA